MARYDAWLAMQRQLVDNGSAAQTIVLESPSGDRFGTWPIGFKDIEESVAGMLLSVAETLPKGRHQCRLVSFDSQGAQLGMIPVVIVGNSDGATEAAAGRLNQERANSIFISNAEKQLSVLMKVLEQTGELLHASVEANIAKEKQIDQLLEATKDQNLVLLREQGRQERLGAMWSQFAPLVEVGIGLVAQYSAEWMQKRQDGAQSPSPPAREKEPPPAEKPLPAASQGAPTVAQLPDVGPPEAALSESPESRDNGRDPSVGLARADVQGRDSRSGGSHSGRDGCHPKNSERRRTTGRRSS